MKMSMILQGYSQWKLEGVVGVAIHKSQRLVVRWNVSRWWQGVWTHGTRGSNAGHAPPFFLHISLLLSKAIVVAFTHCFVLILSV